MKITIVRYFPTPSFCDWKGCRYYVKAFNNREYYIHSAGYTIEMNLEEYKALNINDELKASARFRFSLIHFIEEYYANKITLCPYHYKKLLEKRPSEILYELI